MPIGYGSKVVTPGLVGRVGYQSYVAPSHHHTSWWWLVDVLTVIAEIGVGAFTGGAGAVAVGLAGAGIRTAVAAGTGKLDLVNVGIDFGAALIPGLQGAREISKTAKFISQVDREVIAVEKALAEGGKITERLVGMTAETIAGREILSNIVKTKSTFEIFDQGVKGIAKNFMKDAEGFSKAEQRLFTKGLLDAKKAVKLGSSIGDLPDLRSQFKALGLTEKQILGLLDVVGAKTLSEVPKFSREVWDEVQMSRMIKYLTELKPESHAFSNFQIAFKQGLENIEKMTISELSQVEAQYSVMLGSIQRSRLNMKVSYADQMKRTKKSFSWLMKHPGSAEFNEKIVQRAQWIDPNDVGRAPLEALYQSLKTKIRKAFAKSAKALSRAEELEEAFVKTGGHILNSTPMLGYKIITSHLNQFLILISFRPEATNNKKPVMVWASLFDIEKLVSGTMTYYLKRWAISRGGHKISMFGSAGGMGVFDILRRSVNGPITSMIGPTSLSYLNLGALRNVLSIVSNWVENGTNIVNGTYFSGDKKNGTYLQKLTGSFSRTLINRTLRLASREGVGGWARNHFSKGLADFIGRELQRTGSTVIAPMIKNVMAGNKFNKGITINKIAHTVAMASMSYVRRGARIHQRNTGHVNHALPMVQFNYKAHTVTRIPNAFMPGRPYKGWKIKTNKWH